MTLNANMWARLGTLSRIAIAGGLVAIAAGALPGCIIVADGTKTVFVSDSAIAQSKLDQVRLGQTTEDELFELLGTPNHRSLHDGKQTWTYTGGVKSGKTVVYIDDDDDEIRTDAYYAGKVVIELTDGVVTSVKKD